MRLYIESHASIIDASNHDSPSRGADGPHELSQRVSVSKKRHTILFLTANPNGLNSFAIDREMRTLQLELVRAGYRDCFEFVTRWASQPLDLLHYLRSLKPTVVHFSSRGGQSEIGEHHPNEGLFFQGPDGRPQAVSALALEETFGAAGASVELVLLNACYTDAQAEALLAHVGCVVRIGGSVCDDAAQSFLTGFYGGIGERESIAVAYKQGCAAISLKGLRDAARPQLKVRAGVNANQLVLAAGPR